METKNALRLSIILSVDRLHVGMYSSVGTLPLKHSFHRYLPTYIVLMIFEAAIVLLTFLLSTIKLSNKLI